MQDQCECVDDADDWCWCEGKDGFQPWMMSGEDCAAHGCEYYSEEWGSYCSCEDPDSCASAGGEPNCQSFAPMAFKGNFTVEMCIDCSNFTVADDLGWAPDGTMAHSHSMGWCYSELDDDIGCTASPGDCWAMCEDAYGDDLVAIDWEHGECYCQNDCQCMENVGDNDVYLITRDSFAALPHECGPGEGEDGDADEDHCTPGWHSVKCLDDGTVMRGEGCASCGDCAMYDFTAATGGRATCKLHGPDGSYSYSYSHSYSYSYGQGVTATYYFDGVEQAVEECWYDDCSEDEDEDWRWANSCRQDYCTSMGDDCYASMDWGEPATCSNGYFPSPPNPPGHDDEYLSLIHI